MNPSEIDPKIRHLEMIQGIINRLAGNLFFLKGWSITLVAALFALSAKETNSHYVFVAYIPALVFWLLDGYFLSRERRFRNLYEHVADLPPEDIDFSMDTSAFNKLPRNSWFSALTSATLFSFYLPQLLIMLAIMIFIKP